jgi:hypothetical protein
MGKFCVVDERETAGKATTPVPLRAAVCGEPVAVSATLNEAESAPPAAGRKVTVTAQEELVASDEPQLLVWENEVGFVPLMEMLEMVSAAVPVLLSVTACVAADAPTFVEAKARLVGERLASGTPTPVPLRVTAWGVLAALSAKLSEAESGPAAAGLNVTNTVQDALTASDEPQLLVRANAETFAPPTVTDEIVSAPVPVLVRVTVCAAEDAPTLVDAKLRLPGERLAAGTPTPVPVRAKACGELAALSVKLSEAESAPAAKGLKMIETVQEAVAASDAPQLLVARNEVGFVPPTVTEERVSAAVPELVRVTSCAAEETPTFVDAKARLAGERLTTGAEPPVPLNTTVCGELAALSAKLIAAVSAPGAVGLK